MQENNENKEKIGDLTKIDQTNGSEHVKKWRKIRKDGDKEERQRMTRNISLYFHVLINN